MNKGFFCRVPCCTDGALLILLTNNASATRNTNTITPVMPKAIQRPVAVMFFNKIVMYCLTKSYKSYLLVT